MSKIYNLALVSVREAITGLVAIATVLFLLHCVNGEATEWGPPPRKGRFERWAHRNYQLERERDRHMRNYEDSRGKAWRSLYSTKHTGAREFVTSVTMGASGTFAATKDPKATVIGGFAGGAAHLAHVVTQNTFDAAEHYNNSREHWQSVERVRSEIDSNNAKQFWTIHD